jgi:hypothetical protein
MLTNQVDVLSESALLQHTSFLRQLVLSSRSMDAGMRVPLFYDRGVLYMGRDRRLRPVSRVAFEALVQLYFQTLLSEEPIRPLVRGAANDRLASRAWVVLVRTDCRPLMRGALPWRRTQ